MWPLDLWCIHPVKWVWQMSCCSVAKDVNILGFKTLYLFFMCFYNIPLSRNAPFILLCTYWDYLSGKNTQTILISALFVWFLLLVFARNGACNHWFHPYLIFVSIHLLNFWQPCIHYNLECVYKPKLVMSGGSSNSTHEGCMWSCTKTRCGKRYGTS